MAKAWEVVGLGPDVPLGRCARLILETRFSEMMSYRDGTLAGTDIEQLHSMRVSSRRLLSAMRNFRDCFDPDSLRIHSDRMREIAATLGAVRDLDVRIDWYASLLAEASDNFKAYGVPGHRHHPEITQGLARAAGRPVNLVFVPHLTPMIRGIHATLYARLTGKADLQTLYEKRYAKEAFVDVMPAGSHPDTRSVRGANFCRVAVHPPRGGDIAVVLSVIDNLVKGASGQAVQNMNIMFGLPETAGLEQLALIP